MNRLFEPAVQRAAVAALGAWKDFVPKNVAVFRERRDAAVESFRAAGFACETPRASMYLWLPLPSGVASKPFYERMMQDEGVIVLPTQELLDRYERLPPPSRSVLA